MHSYRLHKIELSGHLKASNLWEIIPDTQRTYGLVEAKAGLGNWLVGLVYSCCSHLVHRTSVKRFVLLQLLNLRQSVGILGRVISPSQGCYLTQRDIHASSRIRTHDPSVRASEDSSCLGLGNLGTEKSL
jgi:hypothetical protein